MTKPCREKVLQVTTPQACRLDCFWGSGFPKKRLESAGFGRLPAGAATATRWQYGAARTGPASHLTQARA